jgi:hypothetical protein
VEGTEKSMVHNDGVAFEEEFSFEGGGQFSYDFSFEIPLPEVLGVVVVVEIAVDAVGQIRTDLFVPHVDVDGVESGVDLELFRI